VSWLKRTGVGCRCDNVNRRRTRSFVVIGALMALLPVVFAETTPVGAVAITTSFSAVGPIRLIDTRDLGAAPGTGATIVVPVRSIEGVPADAVAASVTIVATEARQAGFVTVWGDGPQPATSALNLDRAGQTRANFAITPIGSDGNIRLYTQAGTHLVVDLTGVFRPSGATATGRLVPLGPSRLLDTRTTLEPLARGEERTIDATAVGVPATASAVVLSFTGIGAPGWFAAWPAGTDWPGTSVVNTETPGAPATASAIVPLANGRFDITSLAGGDVVLDVNGYFTGAGAPVSTEGLFVPWAPTRVADTRSANDTTPAGPAAVLTTGNFPFSATVAGSVAMNITTIDPSEAGFLTAFPYGTMRPNASVANVLPSQVLAAGTITPSSSLGVSVYTQARAHLVIDTTGYFVTAARPAPTTTPESTSFDFSVESGDGTYARWNPCSVIQVRVDFTGAQPHARVAFADAIEQAITATGLTMVVTEVTTTPPPQTGQILVRWGTSALHPSLTGSVLGIGGFTYSPRQILRGDVMIRSDLSFANSRNGEDLLTGTLTHELGHVLGLAHVNDPTQLMYAFANGYDTYQAGDRAGLRRLGVEPGCIALATTRTEAGPSGEGVGTGGGEPIGTIEFVDVGERHDDDH